MKRSLGQIVESFGELRVLVLGEAMLDAYLEGTARSVSREAPVPVVTLAGRREMPGGAANTVANVRALGAHASFLSAVGGDEEGARLAGALAEMGVDTTSLLVERARRTLVKNRLLAASQMLVRFDEGTTGPISGDTERRLIELLRRLFAEADAVIVSDYRYGIVTPSVIDALRELQRSRPRVLVVDSRDLRAFRDVGVTAVKPNYAEAVGLVEAATSEAGRGELVAHEGERILAATGARIAAVTLDREGAVVVERGRPPYRSYTHGSPSVSATGAGDTFLAALALALAAGASTPEAAEIASAAAGLVVGKEATSTCRAEELGEVLSGGEKHVDGVPRLAARVALERERGRRIVFTNGCFDILHRGHVTLLSRAKALGDVLVVAVNADESVRRLKGEDRPVNTLEDRLQLLSALSCVDFVVSFEEDSPSELLRATRPDVFVKGGDYTRATLPEVELVEELGGEVRILPYFEDHSTSGVIERIRTLRDARADRA